MEVGSAKALLERKRMKKKHWKALASDESARAAAAEKTLAARELSITHLAMQVLSLEARTRLIVCFYEGMSSS